MDQVKIYLAVLKKHHFWLLAALAAVTGVVCWWMGASSLASQTTSNRSLVDGKYKSVSGLNGPMPNASFPIGVNELHEKLKVDVLDQWRKQYDDQQKLFKWPDVKGVKDVAPGQTLSRETRQMYKNLVFPAELERIYTLANIRRQETRGYEAPDRPQNRVPEEEAPLVPATDADAPVDVAAAADGLLVWDAAQRAILDSRYDLRTKPGLDISEVDLRTAQEDMWVFEQLVKIIAKTNEGASDEAALAVKRISSLDVAQWAVEESQRNAPTLRMPRLAPAAAPALGDSAQGAPIVDDGSTPPPAEDAQQKADNELLEGRYLNSDNQPAAADDFSFAEFRRIFVRMKLDVDQRKLAELLINCANSELPLDVLRVRVDLPLTSNEKTTTGSSGIGGGGGGNETRQAIIAGPFDVPVEICGVIQIYNPADETKLAQGMGDPTKRSLEMPVLKVKLPRGGTSAPNSALGGNLK